MKKKIIPVLVAVVLIIVIAGELRRDVFGEVFLYERTR